MEYFTTFAWWHWYLIAILLLGLEMLTPVSFFLWLGVGAGITGVLVQMTGLASWQSQCVLFVALSFVALLLGRRFIRRAAPAEHSTLNRRLAQYVGRTFVLEQPITDGHGRARFGDTLWRVPGPTGCTVLI